MRRLLCGLVIVFAAVSAGCVEPPPPPPPKITPKAAITVRPEKGFRKKPTAPESPEQEAIFTVLEAEAGAFKEATLELKPDSPPSVVAKALLKYADAIDKLDVAPTPAPFGTAFTDYRTAVRVFQESLARLPDAYTGTQFGDMMKALFRGDSKTGKPLGGDIMSAVGKVSEKLEVMYAATRDHGFEVDR
ncbi:MAG: hypothetical protein ACRC7O_02600 [Fimbriiglobus sp.]